MPGLVLLTDNGAASKAVAEAVGQSLKEAGLQVTIEAVEPDTFTERATKGDGSTYDLAIGSWNPDYPSANANIQPLFASSEIGGGGVNFARYSNAEVDAAIDRAQADLDAESARAQWTVKMVCKKRNMIVKNTMVPGTGRSRTLSIAEVIWSLWGGW